MSYLLTKSCIMMILYQTELITSYTSLPCLLIIGNKLNEKLIGYVFIQHNNWVVYWCILSLSHQKHIKHQRQHNNGTLEIVWSVQWEFTLTILTCWLPLQRHCLYKQQSIKFPSEQFHIRKYINERLPCRSLQLTRGLGVLFFQSAFWIINATF